MMVPPDALALDLRLTRKLGRRGKQSFEERARELLAKGSGATNGQEAAARILLDESIPSWERMRRADEACPHLESIR